MLGKVCFLQALEETFRVACVDWERNFGGWGDMSKPCEN